MKTHNEKLDRVFADWARLGVAFFCEPSKSTPDIERLLLDTARYAPENTRLFKYSVLWLSAWWKLIDVARLRRLAAEDLEEEFQPNLAVILEEAAALSTQPAAFQSVVRVCHHAGMPQPFFIAFQGRKGMSSIAEKTATSRSRQWGRWVEQVAHNSGSLRPREWMMAHNPTLASTL